MRYIMSDMHGDFLSFKKMLRVISFNPDDDKLIVVGDIVDRGKDGIKIINFLQPWVNKGIAIICKGNHELFMQMYLEGTLSEYKWTLFGGGTTLSELKQLNEKERERLLSIIKSMPLYVEEESPVYGSTVITHSGILYECYEYADDGKISVVDSIRKAAQENMYDFLVSEDIHYIPSRDTRLFDKFVICGHRPTLTLNSDRSNKIYRDAYYMDVDSGNGYRKDGGALSCYCIDNDKEYYV